jgi:hypothetical protein
MSRNVRNCQSTLCKIPDELIYLIYSHGDDKNVENIDKNVDVYGTFIVVRSY